MEPIQEVGQAFLETKFGRIFYLCCGFYGDPLILIIHGSGPNNSSREYEFFLFEYIAKICFIRRFFIVAIDCPGYGNSSGSKQSIRSYPLELIEEIYRALNYSKAFALFGHSQGGSAIFNAVHQKSSITDVLLMDRPVCGDIKRFVEFQTPCLLVYDIEDDGHPIGQGLLLHKYMKYSRLLTYKTSREPYWIADNLWESVLDFLDKLDKGFAKRSSSLNQTFKEKAPMIPSEAYDEVPFAFNEKKVRMHHSLEKQEKKETGNKIFKENNKKNKEKPKRIEDMKNNKTKEKKSPIENKSQTEKILEKNIKKNDSEEKKTNEKIENASNSNASKFQKGSNNIKEAEEEKKGVLSPNETLEKNFLCSVCLEIYYKPIQLLCKHTFCLPCLNDLAFYENRCPLCRQEFPENFDKTERNINQQIINEMKKQLPAERLLNREEKALKEQQKQNNKVLFMAYGYDFKEIGTKPRIAQAQAPKKFEWKIYVKQINFLKQNMIKRVEFDINVGVIGSKPIKVEKSPYILEGKGAYHFSPKITIVWDNILKLPPYEVHLRVDFSQGNRSKKFMIR